MALSLGIPEDIPAAVALLRTGRRIKVDMGMAACGKTVQPFLLACVVGLVSAIFPSADDIQHGNLARIGDFLAALAASPPAEMCLVLDNKQEIRTQGHLAVVSSMPYVGLHFQVGAAARIPGWLAGRAAFYRPVQAGPGGLRRPEDNRGWDGGSTHPALPGAAG